MALLSRKTRRHRVQVRDVRPTAASLTEFDRYYLAHCECHWFGEPRPSVEEALADAYGHAPDVTDRVLRPVG